MPRRKHQLYAPGQAARLGGRKGPVKRGVGMGVQVVADPDQALGLAVARIIREGLYLARPSTSVRRSVAGRAPRAQRFHEHPNDAGAASHVCVVVGSGTTRARRLRRSLVAPQRFGLFVHADHWIARSRAGYRGPAPLPRSPPPAAPADSAAAPETRSPVRFLARGVPFRS